MRVKIFLLTIVFISFWTNKDVQANSLQEWRAGFRSHLQQLPKGVESSIKIEKLGSGELVAEHNPEIALVPASGIKLITAGAALSILEPGKTIKTKVIKKGNQIILQGNGDPFLVSEKLWLLARDVASSGEKNFEGGVFVDNSFFDKDEGTLSEFGGSQPYTAKLSATSLNFNSLEIKINVRKNPSESKAVLSLGPVPHEYATLENKVRVVKGEGRQITVEPQGMRNGKEVFLVSGAIGEDLKSTTVYSAVNNPAAYVGHAFSALLKNFDVKVGAGYMGVAQAEAGEIIAEIESNPIDELVKSANQYSNNFMAEQIFRIIGAEKFKPPATAEKARRAVREYLSTIPPCNSGNIKVDNGSGLTWASSVTSNCFVALLQKHFHHFSGFAELAGSTPIATFTGTMKNRFKGSSGEFEPKKVRAKTGTLWSKGAVTSLIGFTTTKKGEPLVFSIIQNHPKQGAEALQKMRLWEEKLVELLQKLDKVSPDAANMDSVNQLMLQRNGG